LHSDQKKIIINFTPTGMIPTKEITPYVPITPDEIVEDVLECAKLGANITHIPMSLAIELTEKITLRRLSRVLESIATL